MIRVTVSSEDAGVRLDRVVHDALPGISRADAQRLIQQGHVLVDGMAKSRSARVQRGMVIEIDQPEQVSVVEEIVEVLEPTILFEDDHLVVVDKPVGLVTHAAPGAKGISLAEGLAARGMAAGGEDDRPGIVHRLDRETSGLLVVARDDTTLKALQKLMKQREIMREYIALVHGRPPSLAGRIEAPIGRDPANRTRRAVDGVGARPATTHFELVEAFPEHTLLAVKLETGRTHQIRVHFAAIGFPIVGDPVYGPSSSDRLGLKHQALHAHRIAFIHPVSGAQIDIASPVPADFARAIESVRGAAPDVDD